MSIKNVYTINSKTSFFKPAPKSGGGAGRVIFVNKNSTTSTIENRYISGSGVGSVNGSARRALLRRASSKNINVCQCLK